MIPDGVCQRLDADIVFLVRTPDLGGEGCRDSLGDFELGRRIQNADRADVLLLDTTTAANHRQEPARLRVLPASNGSAEPDPALCHLVTRG